MCTGGVLMAKMTNERQECRNNEKLPKYKLEGKYYVIDRYGRKSQSDNKLNWKMQKK